MMSNIGLIVSTSSRIGAAIAQRFLAQSFVICSTSQLRISSPSNEGGI
ncbi:hypothetical protein [Nostoc sp. MS1]|nr:hypothetical protein [Nostoc sp. MS1]